MCDSVVHARVRARDGLSDSRRIRGQQGQTPNYKIVRRERFNGRVGEKGDFGKHAESVPTLSNAKEQNEVVGTVRVCC